MDLPVTRTFVPPWEEFEQILEGTWKTGHLTNHGPLVERLELALAKHLGVSQVVCVANGTLALWAALQAAFVRPGDEVLVPAFTYVATAAAVHLAGARPVLVDIDPETLCMDPWLAREAITDETAAILPVHVYGTSCDTSGFGVIEDEEGIPVIYDAAHAFASGMTAFGTASAFSFHATKLFHTAEGGAVATDNAALADAVRLARNFSHVGQEAFGGFGINAKMSEIHAAVGLAVLPHVPDLLVARRAVAAAYWKALHPLRVRGSLAYVYVLFEDKAARERVAAAMEAAGAHPRRYFSPALSALSWCAKRAPLPVAESAADRVLCLPLSHLMTTADADRISSMVLSSL